MKNENRGITPLIIVLIVGVVLVAAGIGGYFGWKAHQGKSGDEPAEGEVAESSEEWIDEFGDLDFSVSGLASSGVPGLSPSGTLDLELPDLDLSGLTGVDLDLTPPEPDVDAPPVPDIGTLVFDFTGLSALAEQAGPPPGAGPPANVPSEEPPTEEPPAEEPPSEPPPQSQVNASNCAQFAAMPSASYCSQVGDPNGRQLCEDCKAAGY